MSVFYDNMYYQTQVDGINVVCSVCCRRMGDQEEGGVDDETSDRDTGEEAGGAGGRQGGGGLGAHRHHEHHRGHGEAGVQPDRGEYTDRPYPADQRPTLRPIIHQLFG